MFASFTFIATSRLAGSHERWLLPVLQMKVSPLGPVNRPCAASIVEEPFWPRSVLASVIIYNT